MPWPESNPARDRHIRGPKGLKDDGGPRYADSLAHENPSRRCWERARRSGPSSAFDALNEFHSTQSSRPNNTGLGDSLLGQASRPQPPGIPRLTLDKSLAIQARRRAFEEAEKAQAQLSQPTPKDPNADGLHWKSNDSFRSFGENTRWDVKPLPPAGRKPMPPYPAQPAIAKPGFKWDPWTGKFVPMTPEEKAKEAESKGIHLLSAETQTQANGATSDQFLAQDGANRLKKSVETGNKELPSGTSNSFGTPSANAGWDIPDPLKRQPGEDRAAYAKRLDQTLEKSTDLTEQLSILGAIYAEYGLPMGGFEPGAGRADQSGAAGFLAQQGATLRDLEQAKLAPDAIQDHVGSGLELSHTMQLKYFIGPDGKAYERPSGWNPHADPMFSVMRGAEFRIERGLQQANLRGLVGQGDWGSLFAGAAPSLAMSIAQNPGALAKAGAVAAQGIGAAGSALGLKGPALAMTAISRDQRAEQARKAVQLRPAEMDAPLRPLTVNRSFDGKLPKATYTQHPLTKVDFDTLPDSGSRRSPQNSYDARHSVPKLQQ